MPEAAQATIIRLQPYVDPAANRWLVTLSELNNDDKHRVGFAASARQTGFALGHSAFADRSFVGQAQFGGAVQSTTPDGVIQVGYYTGWHEIAGVRFDRVPLQIGVDATFLGDELKGKRIAPTVRELVDAVDSTAIGPLKKYL